LIQPCSWEREDYYSRKLIPTVGEEVDFELWSQFSVLKEKLTKMKLIKVKLTKVKLINLKLRGKFDCNES